MTQKKKARARRPCHIFLAEDMSLAGNRRLHLNQVFVLRTDFFHFGERDVGNIRLMRILAGVVLVIGLGWIKGLERFQSRHDRARKMFAGVEFVNKRLGQFLFLVAGIENRAAVLGTGVVALSIESRWVVGL